jgi:hypothetical protein
LFQCLSQPMQVGKVVLLGKEARLTVVAALDDVQRQAIKVNAGAAGHDVFMLRQF